MYVLLFLFILQEHSPECSASKMKNKESAFFMDIDKKYMFIDSIPLLGISGLNNSEVIWEKPFAPGILVMNVLENTPAQKAGLLKGDVIIEIKSNSFNEAFDSSIKSWKKFMYYIRQSSPTEIWNLKILRNRADTLNIKIKLGKHPEGEKRGYLGAWVEFPKNRMGGIIGYDYGLVILKVQETSLLKDKIEPGDFIYEVNDKPIYSFEGLRIFLKKLVSTKKNIILKFKVFKNKEGEIKEIKIKI